MNPFHSHFNQEPLPEDNAEPLPELSKMKKVRTEHLNPSLVLQLSGKALAAHKNKEDEEDKPEYRSKKSFSHVRKLLMSNWNKTNRKALRKNIDADVDVDEKNQTFSSLQDAIYTPISSYCDAQITCANRKNVDAINNAIALHIMNHVLTANNDITTHNNQIRDMKDKEGEEIDDCKEWRDQGYTRPKVLVLLPTKSTAHNFVNDILKLLGPDSTVENLEQFDGEFGNDEKHIETDERTRGVLEKKGQDWNELFADHVNSDDDFKVGLAFSKKKIKKSKKTKSEEHGVAVKLFSDFYYSDIIIASPLGLKMCITTDEEEEGDADFLSSIDILVSLQSDVMLMQNWDHVVNLMERINQQPKKSGKTDFSRVRNYLLLGQAARWKQFIMVSRFSDPHLLSTFNKTAKSLAGRMKLRRKVAADEASICNVMTKVRQVFQRVPCESFLTQGDKRLKYFSGVLLPQLIRTKQNHTLIYIPSYFDFVALRNILLKHDIASSHFVSITEYSRGTEVSRGRARFLQGRKRIMLYTGRAHFFMRHHINGAKHLIMFGLPEHAEFYPELLNMLSWRHRSVDGGDEDEQLDVSAPASCLNLFTKYEAQNLERIVGTKHSDRMVKGEKSTFLFSS
jgi:U3 small nucleolar RNA-associated protein 25